MSGMLRFDFATGVSNRAGNDEEDFELGEDHSDYLQELARTQKECPRDNLQCPGSSPAANDEEQIRRLKEEKAQMRANITQQLADDARRDEEEVKAQEKTHKAAMEAVKAKHQKEMASLRASHASEAEIKAAEQAQELEAVKAELNLTQGKLIVSQKTARRSMAVVTQSKNDAAASKAKAAEYQRQNKKLEQEKAAAERGLTDITLRKSPQGQARLNKVWGELLERQERQTKIYENTVLKNATMINKDPDGLHKACMALEFQKTRVFYSKRSLPQYCKINNDILKDYKWHKYIASDGLSRHRSSTGSGDKALYAVVKQLITFDAILSHHQSCRRTTLNDPFIKQQEEDLRYLSPHKLMKKFPLFAAIKVMCCSWNGCNTIKRCTRQTPQCVGL